MIFPIQKKTKGWPRWPFSQAIPINGINNTLPEENYNIRTSGNFIKKLIFHLLKL